MKVISNDELAHTTFHRKRHHTLGDTADRLSAAIKPGGTEHVMYSRAYNPTRASRASRKVAQEHEFDYDAGGHARARIATQLKSLARWVLECNQQLSEILRVCRCHPCCLHACHRHLHKLQ